MKNIANIITGSRIVFSIAILFIPPFAPMFYVLYAAAGLTDMIDGTVARKTNTVSAFGAKLDHSGFYICRGLPDQAAAGSRYPCVAVGLDSVDRADQGYQHHFRGCGAQKADCRTFGNE